MYRVEMNGQETLDSEFDVSTTKVAKRITKVAKRMTKVAKRMTKVAKRMTKVAKRMTCRVNVKSIKDIIIKECCVI